MKGKVLIATPDLLTDDIFSQSVIYMVDQHDEGSVGFILNKPFTARLKDVTFLPYEMPLYKGGPVAPDRLYFIHTLPALIPGAVPITGPFYWGGDLQSLLEQGIPEDELKGRIKFFSGYSGWSPGQLEKEIEEGAWLVSGKKINPLTVNDTTVWKELLVDTNPDLYLWKNAPSNPQLN